MKNVFLFIFLISATLLYSQKCYDSDDRHKQFLILSDDYSFFVADFGGGAFGESWRLNNKDGKVYDTFCDGLKYKVIDDDHVNILDRHYIRLNKLVRVDCSEKDVLFFEAVRSWWDGRPIAE